MRGKKNRRESVGCGAVVAAAGSSSRMGENKLFMDLCGLPVLVRAVMALQQSPQIDAIVIAAREEDMMRIGNLCRD